MKAPIFSKKINLLLFQKYRRFGKLFNLTYFIYLTVTSNPSPRSNRNPHIKYTWINITHCIFSGEIGTYYIKIRTFHLVVVSTLH